MPEPAIEQLSRRLWVVRRPLPMRVEPVSCYVGIAPGRSGSRAITIVDAGAAPHAASDWAAALRRISSGRHHVARIVVTHFHPDHVGGAAQLSELTGAPVATSATTARQAADLWGAGLDQWIARASTHFRAHGMPGPLVRSLERERELARRLVQLPDGFEVVTDGDCVPLDGAAWRVVETPGHADGHVCLYDDAGSRLISGDHLLEGTIPAVGLYPGHADDPLADYLRSLERTEQLAANLVLPAHGVPFHDAARRSRELLAHHDARVGECIAVLAGGPRTAWEVACLVFGERDDASDARFALAETLAHLEYARRYDRICRERGDDGCWRYGLPA